MRVFRETLATGCTVPTASMRTGIGPRWTVSILTGTGGRPATRLGRWPGAPPGAAPAWVLAGIAGAPGSMALMDDVFSTQPGKASSILEGQYMPASPPAAAKAIRVSPFVRIDNLFPLDQSAPLPAALYRNIQPDARSTRPHLYGAGECWTKRNSHRERSAEKSKVHVRGRVKIRIGFVIMRRLSRDRAAAERARY